MSEVNNTLAEIFKNILKELRELKSTQSLIIDEIKELKTSVEQVQHDLGVHKVKLDLMIDNGIERVEDNDLLLLDEFDTGSYISL